MLHGRTANGLRKVQTTTNTGHVNDMYLSGEGTLREAIGDIWAAAKEDDSRIAIEYWSKVTLITARCGDEIEVFERTPEDLLRCPVPGQQQ